MYLQATLQAIKVRFGDGENRGASFKTYIYTKAGTVWCISLIPN